jgi:myo-inositol-1(or 4)-monophosphatase
MERAARKAGQRLRRDFGRSSTFRSAARARRFRQPRRSGERAHLYDELLAARPDWGFVLEEGGIIEGDPNKPRWIIDPLDGTSNFLHGIPHFAISIAAQEPKLDGGGWGDVIAGLCISRSPMKALGRKGAAAGCMTAACASGRRHLDESLIATGIPSPGTATRWNGRRSMPPGASGGGHPPFGAAALDMAWVAGRYEGFWESNLKPWDTAAGCLLVREAGGFVSDWRGVSHPVCDAGAGGQRCTAFSSA